MVPDILNRRFTARKLISLSDRSLCLTRIISFKSSKRRAPCFSTTYEVMRLLNWAFAARGMVLLLMIAITMSKCFRKLVMCCWRIIFTSPHDTRSTAVFVKRSIAAHSVGYS
jgi:hypothetical protein